MSALYLTGNSDAIRTLRTARGHKWARAAVQSWQGSVSVQFTIDDAGVVHVEVRCAEGSTAQPDRLLLSAPLARLLKVDRLHGWKSSGLHESEVES